MTEAKGWLAVAILAVIGLGLSAILGTVVFPLVWGTK